MNAECESSAPTIFESEGETQLIAFNLEFSRLVMFVPVNQIMANILQADVVRALTENGVAVIGQPDPANEFKPRCTGLVSAGGNSFYGVFVVSDREKGLSALESELTRTGVFAHAEIGFYSRDDLLWLRHRPKDDSSAFVPKGLKPREHVVNTRFVETLMRIISPPSVR
ncbi:MAG TPA: hypothetical protein VN765_08340 [Candidatus Acidoferrum sp.]|nr:hypothetical protein [Candidatus Acidoferrum sp.]